ncbi:hypothetical protein BRC91_12935 [Halobacteriales archaeon QS_4_62_28]|nr:MAG: hypothetical protein BRC91_12935 [Halobacteriales archaeon QS_4_62_28]
MDSKSKWSVSSAQPSTTGIDDEAVAHVEETTATVIYLDGEVDAPDRAFVVTEEPHGWQLAVLQNDESPIAQIIVTDPNDEIQNQIGLTDPREVRQVIEVLEEMLNEMGE